MSSIVWFRIDLRLADNPALTAAVKRGEPVIPVFIWAPGEEAPWQPGGRSRWWLHQSLRELDANLRMLGSKLTFLNGPSPQTLKNLAKETGATAVFWNRRHEPAAVARDAEVEAALKLKEIECAHFNAALLYEPLEIRNSAGKPFQVFTPFWRNCLGQEEPALPLPAPKELRRPQAWPGSIKLTDLGLEPKTDWAAGLRARWKPGEEGALQNLKRYFKDIAANYENSRNRPDMRGTSRLSPHLHFGEISPRQIWHALRQKTASGSAVCWQRNQFLAELGWREFSHHLLHHFPHTPGKPLRVNFEKFPWREDDERLKAWQRGRTGYPIVDAGMRELWSTGWMHNRVRMIAASFLVKDLLLSWEHGARWFWDTLVDADLAQNTLNWQWAAGCGADAAPYFRIFNPQIQGEKFDPNGAYVKKWCPELASLPVEWIHQPAAAPASVLKQAGVTLGKNYPEPVINHSIARDAALDAFARMKG